MKTNATQLDEKAMALTQEHDVTEGKILETLCEMRRTRAFAELGYSGVFAYCVGRLKRSGAQAYYFKSVVEKSEAVPEIKMAILEGEISLSQARCIVSVVTPENHRTWISKAKELPQLQLEREVSRENPKAIPRERVKIVTPELSELKAPIDVKTQEGLKLLQDILSQKLPRPATLSEVLAWAVNECREKHDPIVRAKRERRPSSGRTPNPKTRPSSHPPKHKARSHATRPKTMHFPRKTRQPLPGDKISRLSPREARRARRDEHSR